MSLATQCCTDQPAGPASTDLLAALRQAAAARAGAVALPVPHEQVRGGAPVDNPADGRGGE